MQHEPMQQASRHYESVDALERHLAGAASAFDGARLLANDEAERFPEDACAALDACGFFRFYVPHELGGAWRGTDELIYVLRAVARRDLSVAIAHAKTFLGSAPVWVAGDERQRRRVARLVLEGKAVALGLTERAHGADLAASEVAARPTARGFELFGEKWLINNATRGAALSVLARTSEEPGPSSMSVFLVEKALLPAKTFKHHPKIPTLGIRGADISGIAFDGAPVGLADCVGGVGKGLEVALKTLQVTRTLCCGLSLGAGDSALRVSASFAQNRRLYAGSVLDLPSARAKLLGAYADLLLAECAALAAARSLHTAPEQASVSSALVKYVVPTLVDDLIDEAAVILGARHYLRGSYAAGLFQKLQRDHRLVALFDGSTMVNLSALSVQLKRLNRPLTASDAAAAARRVAHTFDLRRPLPAFERERLQLASPSGNDVLDALSDPKLDGLTPALRQEAQQLDQVLRQLRLELQKLSDAGGAWHQTAQAYELARRYALLHAAGCCLHWWSHSRAWLADGFGDDTWVQVCMARARARAVGSPSASAVEEPLALGQLLLEQLAQSESFSILGGPARGAPYAQMEDLS